MMRPCWLLLHRWRETAVSGHATACDFELSHCATCNAYRMGVWFEVQARGAHFGLSAAEAGRFIRAVGRRETEALFELWYDRRVQPLPAVDGDRALYGGPDSPLCCAEPGWETSAAEFARLGAADVDLERCRACGAWRLTTYWPKDSPDRSAGAAARIGREDAKALRSADWERRRALLETRGWYGLA